MHSASPRKPSFAAFSVVLALVRSVHAAVSNVNLSSNFMRVGPRNCVDTALFRLAFSGVLLGTVFGAGCATRADAPPAVAANARSTPREEVEIPRLSVSVAESSGSTVSAPVRDRKEQGLAAGDDDDFDEMPFVKAPALEELGNAETMKRALRWLRWVAPVTVEQRP